MSIAALVVITEPASLPITLADAKNHLRVSHALDDAYISDCIAAATNWAEAETRRKLVTQTVEVYSDRFPYSYECYFWNYAGTRMMKKSSRRARFVLPGGRVQAVNQIDYIDELGALQTLTGPTSTPPGTQYQEDLTDTHEAIIVPPDDQDWPTIDYGVVNAVRIEYVVGWEPEEMPADIRHAIRVRIADMYVNRGMHAKVTTAAADLLAPHVVFAA